MLSDGPGAFSWDIHPPELASGPLCAEREMSDVILSVGMILPPIIIALAFYRRAVAAEKRADAERIWATRIDPMNPHFRQPLIVRKD